MDGSRNVIFYGGGMQSVIPPVLVLLGRAAVFFVIAISRLKLE